MRKIWFVVPGALVVLALVVAAGIEDPRPVVAGEASAAYTADVRGLEAREHPLPLPSTKTLLEYEHELFPWILSRTYDLDLGWAVDKGVRDTGPYIKGQYYGTHPAVRIYYSPKVMYWLTGDPDFWPEGKAKGVARAKKPREGEIPDGGMIVKEMFRPPAARYDNMSPEEIAATLFDPTAPGWTVMIKDKSGSPDGWFWASVWKNQHYDKPSSFNYPEAGFGMACMRCHSVAKEKGTFSALRNILGFEGDPIQFFADDTWREIPAELQPFAYTHSRQLPTLPVQREPGPNIPNAEFIGTFDGLSKVSYPRVRKFPSEANDHVVANPHGTQHFLTSDQCMLCHSGANSKYAFGPIMFLETERGGLNVSPYGEWRWSPMGLAGRDPVFHAQIESEIQMLKDDFGDKDGFLADQLTNTCLRCHGVMGKRQHDIDHGVGDEYWSEKSNFQREWYYLADQKHPKNKYGALARDGISCAVCHHMVEDNADIADFLANEITGQFRLGPPNEMYGPFDDVVVKPMEHSLGVTPKKNAFISKSRLCASCHIINLPVVDWPLDNPPHGLEHHTPPQEEIDQLLASEKNPNFKGFLHRIEQATYLEWLNSGYQDEYGEPTELTQSCQDCHMPKGYKSPDGSFSIDQIETKIATIEDETYPEADYRIPLEEMTVKFRKEGYRRHTFQGLNIFLAEMFHQFNDVLGVRQGDFETGTNGLPFAIENFVQNARERSAAIDIVALKTEGQTIEADVMVVNKTGHRLPSGVGFRRLFVQFQVIDDTNGNERVIWSSGQTNSVGVLLDEYGKPLPEEFFEGGKHHPHHEVITSQNQVQVYEELAKDASGNYTTSFIRRAVHIKDNRLLPVGWTEHGPEGANIPAAFIHATHPYAVGDDPQYANGKGSDIVKYKITLPTCYDCKSVKVRAKLYSQSWAPYYLKDRFTNVPEGPEGEARRRLYYLASHLKTEGTPIEGWKFQLVETEARVGEVPEECDDEGKGCG